MSVSLDLGLLMKGPLAVHGRGDHVAGQDDPVGRVPRAGAGRRAQEAGTLAVSLCTWSHLSVLVARSHALGFLYALAVWRLPLCVRITADRTIQWTNAKRQTRADRNCHESAVLPRCCEGNCMHVPYARELCNACTADGCLVTSTRRLRSVMSDFVGLGKRKDMTSLPSYMRPVPI